MPQVSPFAVAAVERVKIRRQASASNRYSKFKHTYASDRVAFLHDCVEWRVATPTKYQLEAAAYFDQNENAKVAMRGPRGLGKTALASLLLLHFALTRDGEVEWKVVTTASVWRQLTRFLWPEVHKWSRALKWDVIGRPPFRPTTEALSMAIQLSTGSAFAAASNNPELIEGAHADQLFYIFDEAKVIPDATFDSVEGSFSTVGANGRTAAGLAISTPGTASGRFYDIHAHKPGYEDWRTRHVTRTEVIAAGQMTEEWAEQRRRQWGEESELYQNYILGEFSTSSSVGVIPLAWVERACERYHIWKEAGAPAPKKYFFGCAVDVAWTGEDKTVIAPRYDLSASDEDLPISVRGMRVTPELRRFSYADPMETAGRVKGLIEAWNGRAIVDVIGIGAGVFARLKEQGLKVVAFNAAEGTHATDSSGEMGFLNERAHAWWSLREQLDPSSGELIALPPDDTLIGDLTTPKWKVTSSGKIQIESKDDIRGRLGRSTDDGDAIVMLYAGRPKAEPRIRWL